MIRRRVAIGCGFALGAAAAGAIACGGLAGPLLRAMLLSSEPLVGVNMAAIPDPDERDALLADAREDDHVALTGAQLARLGGPPGAPTAVYEIVIAGGEIRCRASVDVEGEWLNVDSRLRFAVEGGRVRVARFTDFAIGGIDLGAALAGWEAAGWIESQLAAMAEDDPSVRDRLAVIERAVLAGDVLEVTLAPGWERILDRP